MSRSREHARARADPLDGNPAPVTPRFPLSLKFTVPLILLAFAATLSVVNLLYYVPRVERAVEEDSRKRLAQEMSRLQSTLEYLLLKGEQAVAHHEITSLAHNHDVIFAALTNDREHVIAATRRAWLGRPIEEVLPQFDRGRGGRGDSRTPRHHDPRVDRQRIARLHRYPHRSAARELRPSRTGSLFLAYDLDRTQV